MIYVEQLWGSIYNNQMVITSLQEKQNRKFYVPIRPGNRGGWSLFEWDSVRDKPYRDREMYLGNSAVIGVLGKGGKWRKMDWYLKTQKKYNDPKLTSEQQQAIKRDMERMRAHLGQEDVDDDDQKLTQEEMKELLKKIKGKGQYQPEQSAVGLGFDKSRVEIKAKPTVTSSNANRLQGIDEIKQAETDRKKQHKRNKSEESNRSRSRSARKQKKSKKQKKHKQKKDKKDKKHRRERQRSRSNQSHSKQRSKKEKKHRRNRSESEERDQVRSSKNHETKRHD